MRLRAHVDVVHAYELTDYWVDGYPGDMPDADVLGDQARRRADDLVNDVVREASEEPELQLRTMVTEGPIADVLLERAHGASLLVVGRRGYGPLPRAVPGSDALQVALRAPCPVLLVPLPDEPAARVHHGTAPGRSWFDERADRQARSAATGAPAGGDLRSAVLVLCVLLLRLDFVLSYTGAFHAPVPRDIPVAVVAPSLAPAGTAEQVAEQLNRIEGTSSMRARSAQRATRGSCWPTATSTACS